MHKAHASTQLKIGGFRMKEPFGKTSFGMGNEAEGCGGVMAQDHGGALKEMLEGNVLFAGNKPGALEQAEGDGGSRKALAPASLAVPIPTVGVRIVRKETAREFVAAQLQPEASHNGGPTEQESGAKESLARRHDPDAAETISKAPRHEGGERTGIGSLPDKAVHQAIHLSLQGSELGGGQKITPTENTESRSSCSDFLRKCHTIQPFHPAPEGWPSPFRFQAPRHRKYYPKR